MTDIPAKLQQALAAARDRSARAAAQELLPAPGACLKSGACCWWWDVYVNKTTRVVKIQD